MENDKNRLNNVGWLMLLIIAALLLLHFLPKIQIGERSLRQVNILADVMKKSMEIEVDSISIDSLLPPPPKPVFVDTCKTGITCIEDYGDSTLRGMTPFYRAIDELALRPRPVRIAYFGDSFIEGDTSYFKRLMVVMEWGMCLSLLPLVAIAILSATEHRDGVIMH